MPYVAERAKKLIGKPRSEYVCNYVVNEMLTGDKLVGGSANSYKTWGIAADKPAAGVVVVDVDGKHVGIFISDKEFIHSSVQMKKVITAPLGQLKYVFPKGYLLRMKP